MLVSTGGFSIFIVGTSRMCDFQARMRRRPADVSVVVPVTELIAARRVKYIQGNDAKHLQCEQETERELIKKGRDNPKIRRTCFLEDLVEEGNIVSRQRLLSCARGGDIIVPFDTLVLGLDWGAVYLARRSATNRTRFWNGLA